MEDEATGGAFLQYFTEGYALDGTWIKDPERTNSHIKVDYMDKNLRTNYCTPKLPSWIPMDRLEPSLCLPYRLKMYRQKGGLAPSFSDPVREAAQQQAETCDARCQQREGEW